MYLYQYFEQCDDKPARMAERLGVSKQAVSLWMQGGKISLANALAVESDTSGKVTPGEMYEYRQIKLAGEAAA